MEIFSAAISLLALFICLIILVPILLLAGLFLGYDRVSPVTQSLINSLLNLIRRVFNLPIPKETTTAKRSVSKTKNTKAKKQEEAKPQNVEDAEFREVS